MQNRTAALLITIATALCCGLFSMLLCVFGILGVLQIPFNTTVNDIPTGAAPMPSSLGYALLCAGVIFLIIPIVVGFIALRKKLAPPDISGPIPPAA